MTSSKSSQKRTNKVFSDLTKEISSFDIFYQLTYMSATSAAGISRDRVFALARELPIPPAQYFSDINDLVANLRYSYPDACRMVGQRVKSEEMKTFLLRLSDALRSGEPLIPFLGREAQVQGENYSNEYERDLESLKKWNDGYTAVTVSVALIVIINMVSSMIYDLGTTTMMGMVVTAALIGLAVAWVLSRAAPQETKHGPLAEGCKEQRLALKLFRIFFPIAGVASFALWLFGVGWGWIMIVASFLLAPIGIASLLADNKITREDKESSAFFRSLGGTTSSRGTTLGDALTNMKIDSFPTLEPDIKTLSLRLNAIGNPELCWGLFGTETGSRLINQATNIFYGTINLGGDPEKAGLLASLFTMRTAMLRAKRTGVAATFTWLLLVMHAVLASLMVFLLEIIRQFTIVLEDAMASIDQGEQAMGAIGMDMVFFGTPRIPFLEGITIGMVFILALTNAFAIVASEGSHLLKIFLYMSILLVVSGVGFLIVPSAVYLVM
jgi:flagellar protein FlaJ